MSEQAVVTPYARGPDGYRTQASGEPYIALSPGLRVADAGCTFGQDEVFALELQGTPGVVRVDAAGRASRLVTLPGVEFLSGIGFDTVGSFGHRLLVTGRGGGRNLVVAVDCLGRPSPITDSAPASEGGIAVAPAAFGAFGGRLIVVDESTGRIAAIAPDGTSSLVAESGLPAGGDVGVESPGFAPEGFTAGGGAAYVADWGVPGNPHPGTDTILRLTPEALARAGVRDRDLLVATEASGLTIAVRCAAGCSVTRIASATDGAHVEGHLIVASGRPGPPAPPPPRGGPGPAPIAAAAVLAAALLVTLAARRAAARRRA